MTAKTPIYGIEYIAPGEPIRATRLALENNAKTIEAALQQRGVPAPGASDLAAVAGRVSALEQLPMVVLRQTASMTVAGGWQAMSWQAEDYDPDDLHNATNPTRVTMRKKGWYRLNASVPVITGAACIAWSRWMLNGSAIQGGGLTRYVTGANAQGETWPIASPLALVDVNQYVELWLGLSSNGAVSMNTQVTDPADGLMPMLTIECRRLV